MVESKTKGCSIEWRKERRDFTSRASLRKRNLSPHVLRFDVLTVFQDYEIKPSTTASASHPRDPKQFSRLQPAKPNRPNFLHFASRISGFRLASNFAWPFLIGPSAFGFGPIRTQKLS
jgi:hypothetical protein